MDGQQAMGGGREQDNELDYPNDTAIMTAAKLYLGEQQYNCVGSSADIYQFRYGPDGGWNHGEIFSARNEQELSFDNGIVTSLDDANKMEAVFSIHEETEKDAIEQMMEKSLSLKHPGILRPYLAGYNKQACRVVSAYRKPDRTLEEWLTIELGKGPSASLPYHVKELIRTAYGAAVEIWVAGSTSDYLAEASSYHMFGDTIKINPSLIRDRDDEENDDLVFRCAFGRMITGNIYPVWRDDELHDLVVLLNNPNARSAADIMGAPVLLSPGARELLYHTFQKETPLGNKQRIWLDENASPKEGWIERAKNADPVLKIIIDGQPKVMIDGQPIAFTTDFSGALHFARVVAAHYAEHFIKLEGQSTVSVNDRVDEVLNKVLPGLLSKRYNAQYIW